jgi:anti-sigma factor ChrR (cupin superfamily)
MKIDLSGVVTASLSDTPGTEVYPGVTMRELWQGANGAKALVLEFLPGSSFTELDEHFPGPEEVFVLSGTFSDGVHEYGPGTFLHNPTGSAHVPQSRTGCSIFVFFPEG